MDLKKLFEMISYSLSFDHAGGVIASSLIEERDDEIERKYEPILKFLSDKLSKHCGDVNLDFIPFKLQRDGIWLPIANYELFHSSYQSTDKIVLHSIVWSHRWFFQYCSYFYPVIHMEGNFFKGESAMSKLFLSSSHSIILSDEVIILQENFTRIRKKLKKLKKIEISEKYTLRYLDEQFIHRDPEIEIINHPIPAIVEEVFNHQIESFLFRIWSKGFLNTKVIQNYVFRLLIYLDSPRFDFHCITFHDTAAASCPNAEATTGVEEWVQDYLSNQPQDSETFYAFVEEKGALSGYSSGQSDYSYVYLLTLTKSKDKCHVKRVQYTFYHYMCRGMILS
ncbi:hypothetical protein C9374_000686 [Naegleria lovaniensis]|uniref:Uncharacterized protein n=1 Tax=Naegleria lovaniensis TaxID=51637 RepID=A0AA88GTC5_NAELO|nr:uncharacterized protein C9374_000686 [Naegleria lovaniensis]KAG2388522.1 hypothetical protein C9374_000686 [Naegleria lovaniensis]